LAFPIFAVVTYRAFIAVVTRFVDWRLNTAGAFVATGGGAFVVVSTVQRFSLTLPRLARVVDRARIAVGAGHTCERNGVVGAAAFGGAAVLSAVIEVVALLCAARFAASFLARVVCCALVSVVARGPVVQGFGYAVSGLFAATRDDRARIVVVFAGLGFTHAFAVFALVGKGTAVAVGAWIAVIGRCKYAALVGFTARDRAGIFGVAGDAFSATTLSVTVADGVLGALVFVLAGFPGDDDAHAFSVGAFVLSAGVFVFTTASTRSVEDIAFFDRRTGI